MLSIGCLGTGYLCIEGGSQRGESRLLLRPLPPDDIRNTTAIAKKLRRSVVVEENFEIEIRGAHTVKISACVHGATSVALPPYIYAGCRTATSPSLAMAEVAADFTFCHRSSDQDYLEIAPNDVDGLVTSRTAVGTLYTIRGVENWVLFAI